MGRRIDWFGKISSKMVIGAHDLFSLLFVLGYSIPTNQEHIKMLEGELASAEAVCEDLQATAELVNASLDESTPVPPPTLAPANRATTGDPKRNKSECLRGRGPGLVHTA